MNIKGDMSVADLDLLARYARTSSAILEFGVGGSTVLISYQRPAPSTFVSVDTEAGWIERTQWQIAETCGPHRGPKFLLWNEWLDEPKAENTFDTILVDGADYLRRGFGLQTWPLLKVGGAMLFHDGRRLPDHDNAMHVVREFYLEVDTVRVNADHSNITVVTKKVREPWRDWNKDYEEDQQ